MRIGRFRGFAEYRSFVITDRFDYMVDTPDITEESGRLGYLVQASNIVFHYIWNEFWVFALSIEWSDAPPTDFGDAERVLHLPVTIGSQMLLHGSTAWEEESFTKLPIGAGRYSIYSKAWNLGADSQSDEAHAASEDKLFRMHGVESYEWIVCPMVEDVARVVRGKQFMF